MPIPRSRKQYRFLQAVAHGRSTKKTSLTAAEAKAGLSEGGSYKSLPERKGRGERLMKHLARKKKGR